MNESEFEFRLLDLLDGNLSDEEFAALESELLRDAGARRAFKRFARLHSDLEIRYTSTAKIEDLGVVPVERILARQRKRVLHGSLLAAAALLVISAVAMWMILTPEAPVSIATFQTAPNSAFTLTYEGDGDAPMGNVLAEGSQIRLVSGTLEGVFASGVRVVANAPCEFRVLKEDRIALAKGVAWFQVPAKAVGFAVETSEMTVVDLGTEFGIIAADRGEDEIHVSKGSVEVTVRVQGGEKQVLQAGQARRVGRGGRLQAIEPDSSRFLTELPHPQTVPITIANHSFEADVLPRDGNPNTAREMGDDHHPDLLPTGWTGFDDGRNNATAGDARGLVSHADDSFYNKTLGNTPDNDANDQSFWTAQRDVYQVLEATLEANSIYTLTVDIGDRRYDRDVRGDSGTPIVRLGTGTSPGSDLLTSKVAILPAQEDGGWVTWTLRFQTGPQPPGLGEPLRVELTNGQNVGWFDNVRLKVTNRS